MFHQVQYCCNKKLIHKCGFQCNQCKHFCALPIGHEGLHLGNNGNIKNSLISITDSLEYAYVNKNNKKYKFTEGGELKYLIISLIVKIKAKEILIYLNLDIQ